MTYSDEDIVNSWLDNSKPWVTAVRKNEIESRVLVTNKAITNAILDKSPKNVLDLGCGEGWLARELNKSSVNVIGMDVSPELIAAATEKGGGLFKILSYEDLVEGAINEKFDIIVCNFSLLGKESVNAIFKYITCRLESGGHFIVQTIHPVTACGDLKYMDGWRKGSWAGFNSRFTNPAPWYFRTLDSWMELYISNGFRLNKVEEPINPQTGKVVSLLMVGGIAT